MLVDYHVHSKMCGHAEGEMEEYVKQGIKKGLGEIGFNEHFPILHLEDKEFSLRLAMSIDEFPIYMEHVQRLQKEFKKHISIKLGCEIDYLHGKMGKIIDTINKYDFDYLYGSVHFLDD